MTAPPLYTSTCVIGRHWEFLSRETFSFERWQNTMVCFALSGCLVLCPVRRHQGIDCHQPTPWLLVICSAIPPHTVVSNLDGFELSHQMSQSTRPSWLLLTQRKTQGHRIPRTMGHEGPMPMNQQGMPNPPTRRMRKSRLPPLSHRPLAAGAAVV